jgi:hypothetical protein
MHIQTLYGAVVFHRQLMTSESPEKAMKLAFAVLTATMAGPTQATAALGGSETGYGSDQASACANAKQNAALAAERNRYVEQRSDQKFAYTVDGCHCSEPRQTTSTVANAYAQWTCEASFAIKIGD